MLTEANGLLVAMIGESGVSAPGTASVSCGDPAKTETSLLELGNIVHCLAMSNQEQLRLPRHDGQERASRLSRLCREGMVTMEWRYERGPELRLQ
jgi:hypothetical protein